MWKWILGAVLFLSVAAGAQAQDSYKIRSGDMLGIEVLEDPSLNRSILVLPDGSFSFPLAGAIRAEGMTVSQVRSALVKGLAPNFASPPSVFVSVQSVSAPKRTATRSRKIDVYLIGEVANPGLHQIDSGTTILQFLAQSGGFTKFAAKKRIQLRRTDPQTGEAKVFSINYRSIERGGNASTAAAQLIAGDVIVVPERRLFE